MSRLSTILSNTDKSFGEIQPFIDYEVYTNSENDTEEGLIYIKNGAIIEIDIGRINLPFFSIKCQDTVNFKSEQILHCLIISNKMISIDCDLFCDNRNDRNVRCQDCKSNIQSWFLIEADNIFSNSPKVNLVKKSHKLSEDIKLPIEIGDKYTEWLGKADIAYKERLGAGAAIYLRSVFESLVYQFGAEKSIERTFKNKWGKEQYKNFEMYTEEVDKICKIIPEQYSKNGYELFRKLSHIAHGNSDESTALMEYEALRRLVIGIIENVKKKNEEINNNIEIQEALNAIGFADGGEKVG